MQMDELCIKLTKVLMKYYQRHAVKGDSKIIFTSCNFKQMSSMGFLKKHVCWKFI